MIDSGSFRNLLLPKTSFYFPISITNPEAMQHMLFDFISKYMTLTEQEKEAIISSDIFRSVSKGTVLLRQGQYSQQGFFVLQGILRTYYEIDGEEKTTAFYSELEALVPVCVTNQQPSEYFVEAVEDSIISVSNPTIESSIFTRFPRFETLCRILGEELLVKKQIDLDEFKISSPEKRYLNLVKNRPDLLQRVPLNQLASFLGIKPQSLSRLRARLMYRERILN